MVKPTARNKSIKKNRPVEIRSRYIRVVIYGVKSSSAKKILKHEGEIDDLEDFISDEDQNVLYDFQEVLSGEIYVDDNSVFSFDICEHKYEKKSGKEPNIFDDISIKNFKAKNKSGYFLLQLEYGDESQNGTARGEVAPKDIVLKLHREQFCSLAFDYLSISCEQIDIDDSDGSPDGTAYYLFDMSGKQVWCSLES